MYPSQKDISDCAGEFDRSPAAGPQAALLLDFQQDGAPAVDGFAPEAPVGADLESGQCAFPKQAIDGRGMRLHQGMQLQEVGKLADGHEVALGRLF